MPASDWWFVGVGYGAAVLAPALYARSLHQRLRRARMKAALRKERLR